MAEIERSLAICQVARCAASCDTAPVSGWNAYTVLRLVHSHWRWAVLLLWLVLFVRSLRGVRQRRPWETADDRIATAFLGAVDLQLLLGLVLFFFLSPYFLALRQSPGAVMKDSVTRFFAIEHQTSMILAVAAAHIGRVRAKRADPARRHRIMLITAIVFFVFVFIAIPWPGRVMARPLFRLAP